MNKIKLIREMAFKNIRTKSWRSSRLTKPDPLDIVPQARAKQSISIPAIIREIASANISKPINNKPLTVNRKSRASTRRRSSKKKKIDGNINQSMDGGSLNDDSLVVKPKKKERNQKIVKKLVSAELSDEMKIFKNIG